MSFEYQPILRSELLELRPLRADDFEELFAVASDPLIWEQHPVKDRCTRDGFQTFFAESLASKGALAALDPSTTRIIGSSRFHGYDAGGDEVEIGWTFLGRAYWGGVYNGEMKRLMLQHAFRFVHRVIFLIGPLNVRSQKAVEKIGAVRTGSRADAAGRQSFLYEITADRFARTAPSI
jgi:RimJ/RimL family protein N-acetyltransferase